MNTTYKEFISLIHGTGVSEVEALELCGGIESFLDEDRKKLLGFLASRVVSIYENVADYLGIGVHYPNLSKAVCMMRFNALAEMPDPQYHLVENMNAINSILADFLHEEPDVVLKKLFVAASDVEFSVHFKKWR